MQKIPLNSSMLNGSFLLLVQNLPGPIQLSHSKSWLGNGSIVDIPLIGSILRWARLKLLSGTYCMFNNHSVPANWLTFALHRADFMVEYSYF